MAQRDLLTCHPELLCALRQAEALRQEAQDLHMTSRGQLERLELVRLLDGARLPIPPYPMSRLGH